MPSTVQQFWLNALLVRRSSDVEARLVCRRGVWLSRGNHSFTHSPAKSAFPVKHLSVPILGQGDDCDTSVGAGCDKTRCRCRRKKYVRCDMTEASKNTSCSVSKAQERSLLYKQQVNPRPKGGQDARCDVMQ
jgi:hypothetical protein